MRNQGLSGRITDFTRKLEYLKQAFPDSSEADLYKMIANPSSQFGPSGEKLMGIKSSSEQSELGKTTPQVTQEKAGAAATVETAKEKASLGLTPQKAKAAADIETAKIVAENITKKPLERQQAINEKITAVNTLNVSLDNLAAAYEAIPDALKGYAGGKVGESKMAQAFMDEATQAKIQTYNTMKDKMSREVAKAMEGGRISDQDAAFYQKMMGNQQMTPAQARAAVKTLKAYGQTQVKSLQETAKQLGGGQPSGVNEYGTEEEARAAGHKNGDRVKLKGIGTVELE